MTTANPNLVPAPLARAGLVEEGRVRVRVWDLVVRGTHWFMALSFAVLAVTGIYIGRPVFGVPGPARDHFVTGMMRAVHFWAAFVFMAAILARLIWMFTGSRYARWWNFTPATKARWRGLVESVKFYMFLGRRPPFYAGHNPAAGMAYTAVYALSLVLIATGLGLYAVDADAGSFMHRFQFLLGVFGGTQLARWIHHVVMWLLIGFFVQHLYSAILIAIIEKNGTLDSIFSGSKWLLEGEAERERRAEKRFQETHARE